MKYAMKFGLALAAVLAFTSACSMQPKRQQHADLQEITPKIQTEVVWSKRIGVGSEEHFTQLQPAVSDDVIYAADRHGLVVAMSVNDGSRLWERKLEEKPRLLERFPRGESARLVAGPVVAGNFLYLSSENGQVYKLNKASGETEWVAELSGEVLSPVTVAANHVLLQQGNGFVVALRDSDGSLVWQFEEETPILALRSVSRPAFSQGGVLVGTGTGKLQVLLLEGGRLAWEQRISAPTGTSDLERMTDVDGTPLIIGSTVYVAAYNGETAALDLMSGEVQWKRDYSSAGSIQLIRNRLFMTDQQSHIIAFDRFSGIERWRNDSLFYRSLTPVTEHGSSLAAGDRFGYMHWFDVNTGELVGRLELDEGTPIRTAPVRAGQHIVVQTASGHIYLIEQREI